MEIVFKNCLYCFPFCFLLLLLLFSIHTFRYIQYMSRVLDTRLPRASIATCWRHRSKWKATPSLVSSLPVAVRQEREKLYLTVSSEIVSSFRTVGISGKEEGTNDMMIKRELGYIGASQETRGNNWCVSRLFEVYQGSPPVRLSGHGASLCYIPRIVSAPFSILLCSPVHVVLYNCWTSRIRTGWRRRLSSTPMSRFQFVRPPLRFPPSALLTVIMHIWFELLYMSRQCATCRQHST